MTFSTKYTISNKLLANIKDIVKVTVELNNKRFSNAMYSEMLAKTRKRGVGMLSLNEQEEKEYIQALEKYGKKTSPFDINMMSLIGGEFKSNQSKKFLKSLVKYINSSRKDVDSLILGGLFYKHFFSTAPFKKNNETVNIVSTRILLMDMDVNVFNLFNIEKVGKAEVTDNTKWLEYFTFVLLQEMLRVKKELEKVGFKPDQDLNSDQKKILKYLEKHTVITDSEYSEFTQRKKATRVLDFNKLMEKNLIERCGKGRQTHYILK